MTDQLSIFISYSRKDSAFVDRLEVDLRALNFKTWVDRRNVQGGDEWMEILQKAISDCDLMVVVLTPNILNSDFVKMEYRHALRLKKRVIPLEVSRFADSSLIPLDLHGLQWVSFLNLDYKSGLKVLVDTLAHNTNNRPSNLQLLEADLREQFTQAMSAKGNGNLDRALILLRELNKNAPDFESQIVKAQIQELLKELGESYRIDLVERANEAARIGDWEQEVEIWKLRLIFGDNDEYALSRKEEANRNLEHQWIYKDALNSSKRGDTAGAKAQLEPLYKNAPFYGDPDNLWESLQLQLPPRPNRGVYDAKVKEQSEKAQQLSTKLHELEIDERKKRSRLEETTNQMRDLKLKREAEIDHEAAEIEAKLALAFGTMFGLFIFINHALNIPSSTQIEIGQILQSVFVIGFAFAAGGTVFILMGWFFMLLPEKIAIIRNYWRRKLTKMLDTELASFISAKHQYEKELDTNRKEAIHLKNSIVQLEIDRQDYKKSLMLELR
jgi:tetratricopeptide (TPR) repeat protein